MLKLTVPGVPDIYQGGELWDFSLVDPDNRRPVDWEMRRILLHEIAGASLGDLAANWQDGREKLFISYRLLELRRRHPALFAEGDYQPIEVEGERSTHICAFARNRGDETIVVAVPRLVHQLYGSGQTADWGATEIIVSPREGWQDVLTGRKMNGRDRIRASELLGDFPVSVLFGCSAK